MSTTEPRTDANPWQRLKPLHVLGGVCLISAVMITVGVLRRGGEDPPLVRQEFEAAKARWQAKGAKSYDLDIYFYSQNAPVDYHLEVRDGKAVLLTRNGSPVPQQSRRDPWTIDGLLDQMGNDLKIAEDPNLDFGVKPGVQVQLKATFDPTYGYPTMYRRLARGSPVQYSWWVRSFRLVE
jgi:hypothetical protein